MASQITLNVGLTPFLKDVEPVFISTCIVMQHILVPLDEKTFLEFANSFIEGTHWETEMLTFKEKRGYKTPPSKEGYTNLLSSYYKGFMKCHKEVLKSKKPRKLPKDWKDWATYENINKMYDNVYQAMADCGIA